MAQKIRNQNEMIYNLNKLFLKTSNSKKIQKKLNFIGKKILKETYEEISKKICK